MVAVIDTGVAVAHPDLAGARLRTDIDYDFINSDDNADDDNGHGTHVAGIVAASTDNGIGVAGICADCEILPIKVLDAEGSGDVSVIAQGLRYAADQGADIANMSLGMDPNCGCSETIANAINYAYERGLFMIAAAGNDGIDKVGYPASSSRVLAVGATTISGGRAYFSNYGADLDIVAPGDDILSTYPTPEYDTLSGTSMASPMVAGVAGLALSARGMSQPQLWLWPY
jgi:thermitase